VRTLAEIKANVRPARGRGVVPVRRPPEPRRAMSAYLQWSRALFVMWSQAVRSQLEDARAGRDPVTARELEGIWEGLLVATRAPQMLTRLGEEIERDNALYFRKLFKHPAPRPGDTTQRQAAWQAENLRLLRDVGREQIEKIMTTLAQPRADASKASITRATNAARKANVGLITGIDVKQTLQLGDLFKSAQAQGIRHEELITQVQEIVGTGKSRATLIARDQTVKHNAATQQAQAKAAGITRYRWTITRDEATRPMHRALDGKEFSYAQPPVTNKNGDHNAPGEDFQCRCLASPIIDLFAGLSDS